MFYTIIIIIVIIIIITNIHTYTPGTEGGESHWDVNTGGVEQCPPSAKILARRNAPLLTLAPGHTPPPPPLEEKSRRRRWLIPYHNLLLLWTPKEFMGPGWISHINSVLAL